MMDFAIPIFGDRLGDESRRLALSRWATLIWGAVLIGIAWAARQWGSVLEAGLAIGSVPLGALLGVFSLGILTRRVGSQAAIAGMVAGLGAVLWVTFRTDIAWTWYVVIGSTTTFLAGLAASAFLPNQEPRGSLDE